MNKRSHNILRSPELATDHSYFSAWDSKYYSCRACGWSDRFYYGDWDLSSEYLSIMELECGTCNRLLAQIVFPTLDEVRVHWDRQKLIAMHEDSIRDRMGVKMSYSQDQFELYNLVLRS